MRRERGKEEGRERKKEEGVKGWRGNRGEARGESREIYAEEGQGDEGMGGGA